MTIKSIAGIAVVFATYLRQSPLFLIIECNAALAGFLFQLNILQMKDNPSILKWRLAPSSAGI